MNFMLCYSNLFRISCFVLVWFNLHDKSQGVQCQAIRWLRVENAVLTIKFKFDNAVFCPYTFKH
ncbi:hypothetical protein KsCSTR_42010 [Candidatus Kuenenia stuttgartiensis]|uniref:Uncharacterized protein n=1 Tax=Kuenenia stuttgartiensis TaxID=174633 RepID=Q1PXI4_KUEST|nr:hypothetical protein KsCSTR_42010 [Candidatus Kuenenia stuttgartiensis]CAJ71935.1 unknown protein [Candidatus Kuenenia stuttgartiensis]